MLDVLMAITLGAHLGSFHLPDDGQNNFNPGIYAKYEGWTAGAYYNSHKKTSIYAGYTWNLVGPIDFTIGGISGYQGQWSNAKIAPFLVPTIRLSPIRIFVIPKTSEKNSMVIHLGIEKEFQ